MKWLKTKVTLNVWESPGFKITENPSEPPTTRFRLDVLIADGPVTEYVTTLGQAQRLAAMQSELEFLRIENARLQSTPDGQMPLPEDFDDDDDEVDHNGPIKVIDVDETPGIEAITAELNKVMAKQTKKDPGIPF